MVMFLCKEFGKGCSCLIYEIFPEVKRGTLLQPSYDETSIVNRNKDEPKHHFADVISG